MTQFEYTIKILGDEIQHNRSMQYCRCSEYTKIAQDHNEELRKAIKILTEGSAYLRKDPPIAVRYFRNL